LIRMTSTNKQNSKSPQYYLYLREISPNATNDILNRELLCKFNAKPKLENYESGASSAQAVFNSKESRDKVYSLNYSTIAGTVIHLYRQEPNFNAENGIFLRDVPTNMSERQLSDKFTEKFGTVLDVRIRQNGKAVLYFDNPESAKKALSDPRLEGISIEPYEDSTRSIKLPDHILCVQGPLENITQAKMKELFPQSVYVDIIPVSRAGIALIYFADKQICKESTEKARGQLGQDIVFVDSVHRDIYDHMTESCSVFLSIRYSLKQDLSKEIIQNHMISISDTGSGENVLQRNIEYREPLIAQKKSPITVEVFYYNPVLRNKALTTLDRKPCGPKNIPIRVLPYSCKDSQIGVIQIPELPLTITYEALVAECSAYGHILSAALCPLAQDILSGVVLYERYSDAINAAAQLRPKYFNVFPYQPLSTKNVLTSVTDSDYYNAPNRFILIYDSPIPKAQLQDGSVRNIESSGNTFLISYEDSKSALEAYSKFVSQNLHVELLGINPLLSLQSQFNRKPIPSDWEDRLYYVSGLYYTTPRSLRESITSEVGLDVDGAIVYVNNDDDASLSNRGIILLSQPMDEYYLSQCTIGSISKFNPKSGYETIVIKPQQQSFRFPEKKDLEYPRKYLRKFVELNELLESRKAAFLDKVNRMSTDQVFSIVTSEDSLLKWFATLQ